MKSCPDEQNLRSLKSHVPPFISVTVHSDIKGALGSPTAQYQVHHILQLVSPFSLTLAPLDDMAV